MRQEDLARRSEIATATLRRIERGEGVGPSVFVVIRLLEELDLGVEHLNAVI
jgi:transcriptional regulator with XRE-family HTH domain